MSEYIKTPTDYRITGYRKILMTSNVIWHSHPVDQEVRAEQKSQRPLVIWFTGLSASGKSTIAGALEQILTGQGYHTYLLDGDNVI